MYVLLQNTSNSLSRNAAKIMPRASYKEHGTVAGLAALSKDLKEAHADGMFTIRSASDQDINLH